MMPIYCEAAVYRIQLVSVVLLKPVHQKQTLLSASAFVTANCICTLMTGSLHDDLLINASLVETSSCSKFVRLYCSVCSVLLVALHTSRLLQDYLGA